MDSLEAIALFSHLSISPYKRYVDDIFFQTTGKEMADQFTKWSLKLKNRKQHLTASRYHYSISVTISKDGKSSFEFYNKPLFVLHQSAIPKKSKINFICNELKRIEDRCSTQAATTRHQNMFHDILHLNGYPENSIDQTKHLQSHHKDSQPLNTEWSYLKIPYISEQLTGNHKITNIFWKEGIPVRVAHKSYTLRRALSHNTTECTCTRDNCTISNTKLCLLRNAIYQITCDNCNQHYIRSSTSFLHDHVREHLNSENSSEMKHISTCQNEVYKGIKVKTIVLENDPANLCLFKAFHIRKYKPTLNSQKECSELADLLF